MSEHKEEWPAFARLFLTRLFALSEARNQATRYGQRIYVYRAQMDGHWFWAVSFDPKERNS